jgi:hypothetical protein
VTGAAVAEAVAAGGVSETVNEGRVMSGGEHPKHDGCGDGEEDCSRRTM